MPADDAAPPPRPDAPAAAALPPSLAAALAGHAERHPHRPFLIWPEGLDWRWASFAEVAAEVERLRAGSPSRLEETSAAPAAVVAALREVAAVAPSDATPAMRRVTEVAAAGLAAAARAFDVILTVSSAPRSRPSREVVVLSSPIAERDEMFFAWAVVAGAAVVVEPSPAALVATAAWARPTIFRGDAAEVAALAREAEAAERAGFAGWWRRVRRLIDSDAPPPLPFDRLHTLLVAGPLPAEELLAFWRQRGTRVLPDPPPAAAGGAE